MRVRIRPEGKDDGSWRVVVPVKPVGSNRELDRPVEERVRATALAMEEMFKAHFGENGEHCRIQSEEQFDGSFVLTELLVPGPGALELRYADVLKAERSRGPCRYFPFGRGVCVFYRRTIDWWGPPFGSETVQAGRW